MIIFTFSANVKSNAEVYSEDLIDISELPLNETNIGQSESR